MSISTKYGRTFHFDFSPGTTSDDRINYHWRTDIQKFNTILHTEKLQTIPDNYTEGVSNTDRYKMIGNGWTVDVIAHIFSFLKEGKFLNSFSNENV